MKSEVHLSETIQSSMIFARGAQNLWADKLRFDSNSRFVKQVIIRRNGTDVVSYSQNFADWLIKRLRWDSTTMTLS